jgi:Outer membrane protein beta-barrel domain
MNKLTLMTLFFLFSMHLSAQNRFVGGVFGGLNLAQIDGDFQQGYRKKMFGGGIRAAMLINRNFDIGTELMYNGKGAAPSTTDKSSRSPSFYMSMHYAEAALTTNFHFDQNEMGFNQKTVQVGISYGRLLKSSNEISKLSVTDSNQSNLFLQEKLKSTDVSVIVGFAYRFTPRIGFAVRHSYSITPFFERTLPPKQRTYQKEYFLGRSYFLSAQLFYDLWTPELRKPKKARKPTSKRAKTG